MRLDPIVDNEMAASAHCWYLIASDPIQAVNEMCMTSVEDAEIVDGKRKREVISYVFTIMKKESCMFT